MNHAGIVIMYNCSGPEFSKLRQICARLRLRMRPVGPERYHLTLEELAAGTGEPAQAQESFPEPMLVFCGMNRVLLNQVLKVIHFAQLPPIPLKAVLTADNRTWTTLQLREELEKERQAIEDQQKPEAT